MRWHGRASSRFIVLRLDLVDRQFSVSAPNRLWMTDVTYVAIWSSLV